MAVYDPRKKSLISLIVYFPRIRVITDKIIAHNSLVVYLPRLSGGPYYTTPPATTNALAENGQDRARVLCNYDARDPSELSVIQDEVTKFVI